LIEEWFDLNGAALQITAEDGALLAPLLPYLRELKTEPGAHADFILSIGRNASQSPPDEAEVVFEGCLPERVHGRLLRNHAGASFLVVPGMLTLEIAPDARQARMAVQAGDEALIGGSAGLYLIAAVLAASGQHLLHAAGLRLPGAQGGAMLLFAPSGAGKTTAALALALNGFGLLTDDAAVVAPRSGACREPHRVWGLPRALKVHRRTAAMLPNIGAMLPDRWNGDGEQVLTREALRSVADVCAARPLPLAAIGVLGPRASGPHAIRPIKRSEALVLLAADNVFRAPRGVLADDVCRFQSLSRIVADVPVCELSVGPDLSTLACAVTSALA
jgi:hypothetical protein